MTSTTNKIIANAVSGKTARPCDCCIKKRARWYCPADDAFLCQSCDASVHSANLLARRHDRVRLKTASLNRVHPNHINPVNLPSWNRGLNRKTRSPRQAKHFMSGQNPASFMVPELEGEDTTSSSQDGESEDRLLYRVPILDPFVSELSPAGPVDEVIKSSQEGSYEYQQSDLDDLEEFAADVETLLGKGLDEESYSIEELGFFECNNNDHDEEKIMQGFEGVVKEEDEQGNAGEVIKAESDDMAMREPFDLSFVYDEDFPPTCDVQGDEKVGGREEEEACKLEDDEKEVERKMISLRLDYEAISEAWACQGSPWMNGQRPQINLDDSWPHCLLGTIGAEMRHPLFGEYQGMLLGAMRDGGREARVSRYREKRRTRLFSKKIRYEVRKLNAEKRPRMKGRFVKRSSFPPTTTSFPLLSK